ncbi:uncharacterized protein LOC123711401 [Pieris brassicae]|uniref:uncharacterized protein LOC123711401 n=1 Tax=Pieris brassicae TaxID=7116 RepID=UPI001E66016E|nr:uncharacterized protein LOC123711401 [Pieris brassicae]XP_045519930.1 uncharacterized protein LOC123711401 [Pieris brassicae]
MMQACIYILISTLVAANAKILRNNALMTKMVSNFHKDIDTSATYQDKSEPLMQRMQNLLCHNFRTIPCEMITRDETLRKLIEKSIQQINYKKLRMDKTTQSPRYLTLFPMSSGDIHEQKIKKQKNKHRNKERHVLNRKKLRKFYPHKVKYKDKNVNFHESEEKLSMSVEHIPDVVQARKRDTYKMEQDEPFWRIDYMKHEEPSAHMFGYIDRLKDKIIKSSQTVTVDEQEKKDVMRPDVYIRKNKFVRKNINLNDDDIE